MKNKICPKCGLEMSLLHSPYVGNCGKKRNKLKSLFLQIKEVQNN